MWSSGASGNIDITTDASFSLQDQDLGPDPGSDSGIKIKAITSGSDFNSENKISKNAENSGINLNLSSSSDSSYDSGIGPSSCDLQLCPYISVEIRKKVMRIFDSQIAFSEISLLPLLLYPNNYIEKYFEINDINTGQSCGMLLLRLLYIPSIPILIPVPISNFNSNSIPISHTTSTLTSQSPSQLTNRPISESKLTSTSTLTSNQISQLQSISPIIRIIPYCILYYIYEQNVK